MEHIVESAWKVFVHVFYTQLYNMDVDMLSEIPVVIVTKEHKTMIDTFATVIDVTYPCKRGFISIYVVNDKPVRYMTFDQTEGHKRNDN